MKILPVGASALAILALAVSGCATNETTSQPGAGSGSSEAALSGQLQGTGSSAMQAAQEAWVAKFQTVQPNVRVNYAPEGSGAGRTAFIGGGADFAGSDRALQDDEMGAGKFAKCAPTSNALNLPVYVSPIAIIHNVEGVDELKLDATTTARIFKGEIANWNDPAIAALNEGVTFPDQAITPVHRSDDSGTTDNFTETLHATAPDVWTEEADGEWPASVTGGEAAKGTSGVVAAVSGGTGTIGYADESQAQDAKTALFAQTAEGEFVGPTAEAAGKILDASAQVAGRSTNDLALDLDRTAAGYPFVLVAYAIVCEEYADAAQGELVKSYIGYISSEQGQTDAEETAGSAPLPAALSAKVKTSVDSIK